MRYAVSNVLLKVDDMELTFIIYAYLLWIIGLAAAQENATVERCFTRGHTDQVSNTDYTSGCTITVMDDAFEQDVEGYQLLEYTLIFPNYDDNPLQTANTYKLYQWQHIFSKHGETLLSLTFNYDILSMSFLSFGVTKRDIQLVDDPPCCLSNIHEENIVETVEEMLAATFYTKGVQDDTTESESKERLCHYVLDDRIKALWTLSYECCTLENNSTDLSCFKLPMNEWVSKIYSVINIMDVLFLLFGPLILLKIFGGKSFRVVEYFVKVKDPEVCTIKKEVSSEGEVLAFPDEKGVEADCEKVELKPKTEQKPVPRKNCDMYAACLKKLIPNKQTPSTVNTLCIQVDHRRLMSEQDIAVGPLKFVWSHFILCKISRYHPFRGCCAQSIFGSWDGSILFTNISSKNMLGNTCYNLNTRWRLVCNWLLIFRTLGIVISAALVPFPYYIRKAIYHYFEREEYEARRVAMVSRGTVETFPLSQDLKQFICDISYFSYWASAFALFIIFATSKERFLILITSIIRDLKHVRRLQCVRLYFMHILLPFEKFGILGILIGPLYWLIALPIVTFITLFYCIPTIYLMGRFIFGEIPVYIARLPYFVKRRNQANPDARIKVTFLLTSISTTPEYASSLKPLGEGGDWSHRSKHSYSLVSRVLIGLTISICLVSILIIYAEFFRFIVEVGTLTLMGAIVNAGSAGKYFMLVFFLVTYSCQVFNNVTDKYQMLLSSIFSYVEQKLEGSVMEVITLSGTQQKNIAFKYFSTTDIDNELKKQKELCSLDIETQMPDSYWEDRRKQYKDQIEVRKGVLHWQIHSLIYFVDRYDIPRIPKSLFRQIANLHLNGCPGPVYVNLLLAIKELLYMLFFLLFVVLVVLAFGDEVSSGSQLLITLAGGFVPVFATKYLKPTGVKLNLNTYSFDGKINEIIRDFKMSWPMSDLVFEPNLASSHHSEDDVFNAASYDHVDNVSKPVERVKADEQMSRCSPYNFEEQVKGVKVNVDDADIVLSVQEVPRKTIHDDDNDCVIS